MPSECETGADVTVANRRGLSPLDVAAIRGNVKIFNVTLSPLCVIMTVVV